MAVKVTVFTPTFNRGYSLNKLYQSLIRQKNKNFEWVVVDDGSEDNTKELLAEWMEEENGFPIRYFYKENSGKHIAINYGLEKAEGRLFFIVDSDDFITEYAIELILKEEKLIDDNKDIAGIGFNRGKDEETLIGKTFPDRSLVASSIERSKYKIIGDKAEVFYTEILRKYKFPKFLNEKFIPENVVWYKIANDGYKIKWINEIIYICNYLEDGLTYNSSDLAINNFKGYTYTIRQSLQYKVGIKEKNLAIGVYTRIARSKKMKYHEISRSIEQPMLTCFIMGNASELSKKIKMLKNK